MTEQESQELEQCSCRIDELLYKEAVEQECPVSNLGEIEATTRSQLQESVLPIIGAFLPSLQRNKSRIPTNLQQHPWTTRNPQ